LNKKTKLVSACILLLTLVTVAVATGWIYSNTVTVHVHNAYTFTLNADKGDYVVGGLITFTGLLEANGVGVVGATIQIFDVNVGNSTILTNATTIAGGSFICTYTLPATGNYTFQAQYQP
jgi:hypothetical protein